MAHFPKPFFSLKKNHWYVELDGKQINIGPDQDEAFRRYHQIMAARGTSPPAVVATTADPALSAVLDEFLSWCLGHREKRTYEATSNTSGRSSTRSPTSPCPRPNCGPSTPSGRSMPTTAGTPG